MGSDSGPLAAVRSRHGCVCIATPPFLWGRQSIAIDRGNEGPRRRRQKFPEEGCMGLSARARDTRAATVGAIVVQQINYDDAGEQNGRGQKAGSPNEARTAYGTSPESPESRMHARLLGCAGLGQAGVCSPASHGPLEQPDDAFSPGVFIKAF